MRQLRAVASRALTGLTQWVPDPLAGGDDVAFIDIDDAIRQTRGCAKQGPGDGCRGVKDLDAHVAIISALHTAPVITRIRVR